jgi:hypothetical protein
MIGPREPHERLVSRAEEELKAARAEAERHRQQFAEMEQVRDEESLVLSGLTAVRQAIRGEVQDADTVEALRGALERLFRCFVLTRDSRDELRIVPFYRLDHIGPTVERGEVPTAPVFLAGKGHGGLPCAAC